MIWHTFTSSPKEMGLPGQEYFAGTHLNPNVTWWNQAGAFIAYINRGDFLLQQGLPVADAVYYYGNHVPNFVRLKSSDPAKVLPGYDYDVTDENVLTHRMAVRDGRIALPEGIEYRLLVLPDRPAISPDALRAVRKLVADGASVLGPKPQRAVGLMGDAEIRAIAEEVWGNCGQESVRQHRYGKGTVYCGQTTREVLATMGVAPDVESSAPLDYVHRCADGADIYFLRNTGSESLLADVTLRSAGKAPELWHADTGETAAEPIFTATVDGRTRMPLRLEPNGSVFVVLRRPAGPHIEKVSWDPGAAAPVPRWSNDGTVELEAGLPGRYSVTLAGGKRLSADVAGVPAPLPLTGPWTLSFTPGWGAPASISLDGLASWTENADPGVRYYSGTARYRTRFRVPDDKLERYLDLGEVHEIGEVRVNGVDLGILWKKPFRAALGAAVRPGWNELEIAVTNLWPNRLIGDRRLPVEQRLTHTNITKFSADSALFPSGLLGPVTVQAARVVRMH